MVPTIQNIFGLNVCLGANNLYWNFTIFGCIISSIYIAYIAIELNNEATEAPEIMRYKNNDIFIEILPPI